jgi:release factor glutamine methyltransferase
MTLKSLQTQAEQSLASLYPPHEAKAISRMLLMEMLHLSRAELLLSPHHELSETQATQALQAIEQLRQMRPIQHVLGSVEFCGLPFVVNEHTLIPRPETEELVSWIVDERRHASSISILDLGTGSGCIAVALAKQLPQANVCACDISPQALDIAQQNAQRNGVEVRFEICDLRRATCEVRREICDIPTTIFGSQFSIIVSNPPYVCESEKSAMRDNVLRYEPHSALFVPDNDPLVFYTCIAQLAQQWLRSDGEIFVEINERFGRQTAEVFVAHGFASVELRKDIFGKERMMKFKDLKFKI